jgi:hypothetical protein
VVVTPPACPSVVWPTTPDGSEHIAAEDPGAEAAEALGRHFVVDTGFTLAGMAVHLLPDAGVEEPVHQCRPADAERILDALVRAGAEAIERHGEALHAKFGHEKTLYRSGGLRPLVVLVETQQIAKQMMGPM